MRRIAIINQKGGVGKTTTTTNLGAALALQGRRVVLIDMDAQAHLSLCLNIDTGAGKHSTYTMLTGQSTIAESLHATSTPNLQVLPSHIDLSGAEIELSSALGREYLLRDAIRDWEAEHRKEHGEAPADYLIFDCPPSLGLLSINALTACREVIIALQTEFLALQGMSKLMEILQVLRKRMNPEIEIAGILPCLYDSRLKLAREVLGDIRGYFPGQVFQYPIRSNVKLAEAPSFGKTIFEYAPDSNGAQDYLWLAQALMLKESGDSDLAGLPAFRADVPAHTPDVPAHKKEVADRPVPSDGELATHTLRPVPAPEPQERRVVSSVEERAPLRAVDARGHTVAEREVPAAPGVSANSTETRASLHADPREPSFARTSVVEHDASLELASTTVVTAVVLLDEPIAQCEVSPDVSLEIALMPAPVVHADDFAAAALSATWDELPDLPDDAVEISDETWIAP